MCENNTAQHGSDLVWYTSLVSAGWPSCEQCRLATGDVCPNHVETDDGR